MKIELLGTIKGSLPNGKSETWPKGKIFNDAEEKIPQEIMILFKNKSPLVRAVLDADDAKSLEVSSEQIKETLENLEEAIKEIAKLKDDKGELEKEIDILEARIKQLEKEKIEISSGNVKDKELACPHCDNTYKDAKSLNIHITKAHGENGDGQALDNGEG